MGTRHNLVVYADTIPFDDRWKYRWAKLAVIGDFNYLWVLVDRKDKGIGLYFRGVEHESLTFSAFHIDAKMPEAEQLAIEGVNKGVEYLLQRTDMDRPKLNRATIRLECAGTAALWKLALDPRTTFDIVTTNPKTCMEQRTDEADGSP